MPARDVDVALRQCLQALTQRLRHAGAQIHADRGWQASPYAQIVEMLPDDGAHAQSVLTAAFEHVCGPMPVLTDLLGVAGRWSMMPNHALHPRLCALALYRRPGVLRSCVNARVRSELKSFLGGAFEQVAACGGRGRSMPGGVADLPAIHWCCVGYLDVSRHGAWPSYSMRRLVRLGLPPGRAILQARGTRGATSRTLRDDLALIDGWFTSPSSPPQDQHAL